MQERIVIGRTKDYKSSIRKNIEDRFPKDATKILGLLEAFNVEKVPGGMTSKFLKVYMQA